MRADRLLAMMMLLQARGRMTARRLASELEVSERTIYRDISALSASGVPVYGTGGPEGGFELIDSFRTDLTGLSPVEARAVGVLSLLFNSNALDAFRHLSLEPEMKAALRKLAAALPRAAVADERHLAERYLVDFSGWKDSTGLGGNENILASLHTAVWENRRMTIRYVPAAMIPAVERQVEPYGLVLHDGDWHLVYLRSERMRALRVIDLLDARLETACFERMPGFDLSGFWQTWLEEVFAPRNGYRVAARAAPSGVKRLSGASDVRVRVLDPDQDPDRPVEMVSVELVFDSLEAARERLLPLGRLVEVVEPAALRLSLIDVCEQTLRVYRR